MNDSKNVMGGEFGDSRQACHERSSQPKRARCAAVRFCLGLPDNRHFEPQGSAMNISSYFAKDLFHGKTVFITGGSSGINLGIARNFAAVGANLGICGRAQDKLDAASAELRELGARVSAHSADVRDYAALDKRHAAGERRIGADSYLGLRRGGQLSLSRRTDQP
jgi:hypothetical protein